MRIDERRLTFLALVALDEVLAGGPVTQGFRFALAYLYRVGDLDRRWFDQFWQAARAFNGDRRSAEGFGEIQTMTASLNAICRSAIGIVERCEARDAAAVKKSRPRFLGVF